MRAARHILRNRKCALWIDMGLGKTVSTLTALLKVQQDGLFRFPALVVAPKRVAEHVWPNEIRNWEHLRHLEVQVLDGTPQERRWQLNRGGFDIHTISRDKLNWLVHTVGVDQWPYEVVVIDEASGFKDSRTMRWRALRKVSPRIKRMIQLSGTPAPNGLIDLWAQLYMLDEGERLGRTIGQYREAYFNQNNWTQRYDLDEGSEAKIHNSVKDICLSMAADDYLDLPERIDNHIDIVLPPGARSAYDEMERDFIVQMQDMTATAKTRAVCVNKLLQIANGALYTDELNGQFMELHEAKLNALDAIVEDCQEEQKPLLVAYCYRSDIARIKSRHKHAVVATAKGAIDDWNAGKIPLMLAHPASCGHGLNLQHGGSTMVWFGLPWSLELYEQTVARLRRQGQDKPVVVHHILADETADKTVMAALRRKARGQNALLAALKEDAVRRQQQYSIQEELL